MNLFELISDRPLLFIRYTIYGLLAVGFLVTILINKHKNKMAKHKEQATADHRTAAELKDCDTDLPAKSVTLFF